jgi:hypothetical protein
MHKHKHQRHTHRRHIHQHGDQRLMYFQKGMHEGRATALGLPGPNRTGNPQLRRLVLYPVELRAVNLAF